MGKARNILSVEEASEIVLRVAERLPSVTDGYAVVASDGPGEYPVITESRAGDDGIDVTVTSGTVAYCTTGGPIPNGADAVIQVEDTAEVESAASGQKRIRVLKQVSQGLDIRPVV